MVGRVKKRYLGTVRADFIYNGRSPRPDVCICKPAGAAKKWLLTQDLGEASLAANGFGGERKHWGLNSSPHWGCMESYFKEGELSKRWSPNIFLANAVESLNR